MGYLEIWEVLRHEAVDLTDRQTSCFTVHERHEDQGAAATQEAGFALVPVSWSSLQAQKVVKGAAAIPV